MFTWYEITSVKRTPHICTLISTHVDYIELQVKHLGFSQVIMCDSNLKGGGGETREKKKKKKQITQSIPAHINQSIYHNLLSGLSSLTDLRHHLTFDSLILRIIF